MKGESRTRFIAQAAIIAALYIAITFAFQPIAFGPVQMRVSEALCVLVAFTFSAVPGLFVGCLLANLIGVAMGVSIPLDIVLGSVTTLIAAYIGYRMRRQVFILPLPSVLLNAIVIGTMLHYVYSPEISIWYNVIYVGLGQFLACYLIGLPLYYALRAAKFAERLSLV